ncbi:MAG TPA: sulfotransferase domain-containing protein [Polyangia bacterium]|nr:sulfotransferase domain-containing protein [Polyangia bacterium]
MAGPPWLNPGTGQGVVARDGDVWISVPVKSGTNWMMNIVHQLLTGGDGEFDSIYSVVPWPELVEWPGQSPQVKLDRIEAMPTDRRRAIKSHAAPPQLPFIKAGTGKDVRYVVAARNPEESVVSFKIFLDQHTDAFFDLWKVPRAAMTRPDFPTFYREVFDARAMQGMLFGFAAAWWPLRHEKNVLLMHFADMKRDLPGATRKVADFLGITRSAAEWARINEYTSFDWMKKHEDKFDTLPHVPVRLLEHGGMMRKGKVGASRDDGMTEEIAKHLYAVGSKILTDEAALRWLYDGGDVA